MKHVYDILDVIKDELRANPSVNTVTYGDIADVDLDKMSYGEWEDLENYIYNIKDLHKAMAILYRPIAFKKGDRYKIHEYRGSDAYSDIMRDMPIDIALGAKVFFYRLAKKLGDYTIASTLKQFQKEQENNSSEDSVKNGEVIKQYMNSLEEMSEKLNKSPLFHSINA